MLNASLVLGFLFFSGVVGGGLVEYATSIPKVTIDILGLSLLALGVDNSEDEPLEITSLPRSIKRLLRSANECRDRAAWKSKVATLSPKKFRRRFKVTAARFSALADLIRCDVEPDEFGQHMAVVSS